MLLTLPCSNIKAKSEEGEEEEEEEEENELHFVFRKVMADWWLLLFCTQCWPVWNKRLVSRDCDLVRAITYMTKNVTPANFLREIQDQMR